MAITLQQSVQSPQVRLTEEVMRAFPARPIAHNLSEVVAKISCFGAKAHYMQQNGPETLDVVGRAAGKLIRDVAKAMRHRHGDLPALGVKSVQIKSPRVRPDHLPSTQLQVARLDVPRLDQPRFIPCHSRP
jgi:hypothetical protein